MYLLADIGGTKTRLGHSVDGVELTGYQIFDTPNEYATGMELIEKYLAESVTEGQIVAAAIGIAGPLDHDRQKLVGAPHLPGWIDQPLQSDIKQLCNCQQVLLQNDTAVVGLGEATRGAGKDGKVVAYVTFSTGVGGVKITDKQVETTAYGFEPGHQLLLIPQINTDPVSWESLVSGSGITERYSRPVADINEPEIWEEVARYAAIGLHNIIVHWSPDTVVLGGGIISSGKLSLDSIALAVRQLLQIFPDPPVFKQSELGDLGGLYGCLHMLR